MVQKAATMAAVAQVVILVRGVTRLVTRELIPVKNAAPTIPVPMTVNSVMVRKAVAMALVAPVVILVRAALRSVMKVTIHVTLMESVASKMKLPIAPEAATTTRQMVLMTVA